MSRIVGCTRLPDGGHLLQVHHDAAGEVRPGHWFILRLARISHRPSTTHADLVAVKGRTPSSRLDVVSATPSPSSGPCPPSQRHLDALATNGGEKCGPGNRQVTLAVLDASSHEAWLGFRLPKTAEPPPAYGTTCDLDGPFGDTLTPASAGRDMVLVTDAQGLSAALFAATAGAGNDTAPRLVLAELRATPPVRLRPSRFLLPGLPPGTIAGIAPLEDAGIPSRVAHPDGLPGCHDGNMAELLRHWIKHQRAAQRWRYAVTVIGADRFVSELETLLAGRVGEHRGMVIPPG